MYKISLNSIYFADIAQGLHEYFTHLKIPHEMCEGGWDVNDAVSTFIIFTVHEGMPLPPRYIAYNFEQLISAREWGEDFYEKRLKGALAIWDYSMENIKILESKGLHATFAPLGYCKSMGSMRGEKSDVDESKNILCVFVGACSALRVEIIRKVPECTVLINCWGEDLIKMYKQSICGLNLHYYEGKTILEIPRIFPMIANGLWVISVRSDDCFYDKMCEDLVTFVDSPEDIKTELDKIKLKSKEEIYEVTKRRFELLKSKYSYEKMLDQSLIKF